MKKILCLLVLVLGSFTIQAQIHGPTDTLLLPGYGGLFGNATLMTYGYTNGTGYFFGTNFLDLDQDPTTPHEPGVQSIGQGFVVDSGSYYILDIVVHVGYKAKGTNSSGSPLILSVHYLDDSSSYNINTSSGTVSYTIGSPGTSLGSTSIQWDDIKSGGLNNYSTAHLTNPIFVEKNFVIVVDLFDFYLNDDKIGLFCSPANGTSIYGKEFTLWLYPNPLLWLQVDHIYTSMNRAISIFPVVDDGTFGIEEDGFLDGIKLGQSFPNPTSDEATIEYELDTDSQVKIDLLDVSGKLVKTVELGKKTAGVHSYTMETIDLCAGVYYYTLHTEKAHLTKKMIVN